MEIRPLIGIGNAVLGSTKEEVIGLLGKPTSKKIDDWPDDTKSENWVYQDLGLELSFDSEDGYVLSTITTTSKSAILNGVCPIGLSINRVIEVMPSIELDEDFDSGLQDYVYPSKEISFWVINGIVRNLTVFPEYDKERDRPIWPKPKS